MEDGEQAFIPPARSAPFEPPGRPDGYAGAGLSELGLVMVALAEQRSMLSEILAKLPPTTNGAHGHTHQHHEPHKHGRHRQPELLQEAAQQQELHQDAKGACDRDVPATPLSLSSGFDSPPPSKKEAEVAEARIDRPHRRSSTFSERAKNAASMVGNNEHANPVLDAADHDAEDLPRHPLRLFLYRTVLHPLFDLLIGLFILVNTVVMGLEEQYAGAKVGHDLGFYSYYGSTEWAGSGDFASDGAAFRIVEGIFAIVFTVEVLMRMVGLGRKYFTRPSEYFDLGVVVLSDLSILFGDVVETSLNVQLLRLFRGVKLLRLVKLIRTIEGFDALHLMTTALYDSAWALCWSVLLLLTIMTFMAMLVTNAFRGGYLEMNSAEFNALSQEQKDDTLKTFKYFGTFTRSILSLFELTLANWTPICRFLVEQRHEAFMVFVIAFKLAMGFAVVGVINAVFMQETFKVANTDDSIMVRMKMRSTAQHRKKMHNLFNVADTDGSGRLQREEFRQVLSHKSIQTWLAAMDLDARDADVIFDLLSGSDEAVDVDELISGVSLLKGAARSIDMRRVMMRLDDDTAKLMSRLDADTGSPERQAKA